MAALSGQRVNATLNGILITPNNTGITGTIQYITDGAAIPSVLGLSTTGVTVNGTFKVGTSTLSLANNLTTSGNFAVTLTATGITSLTLPTSGTLVSTDGSQALTNKTYNGLTISGSAGTLTIPTGASLITSGAYSTTLTATNTTTITLPTTGTLATLAGSETLTNKTLTTPIIAAISNTGTLTLPTSTDTLIGRATTDTLTNKTLTSPTMTTPVLGVASATSINKVAITAPATSSTLTIADGKTLTASNTLTLTGTDASSIAFGAGGTVAYQPDTGIAWTPGFTGFSVNPTYSTCIYQKIGKIVFIRMVRSANGTSNATGFTITGLPFTAAYQHVHVSIGTDSGGTVIATCLINGTTITACGGVTTVAATWTASGAKGADVNFSYESTT